MRSAGWLAIVLAIGCAADGRPASAVKPAAVHYRYATTRDTASNTSSIIEQLEARAATPIASPEDLGDLANRYVRRAMLEGDPDDYKRAEEMARRSLARRASSNGAALVLAKVASARHDFREAIRIAQGVLSVKATAGTYNLLATCFLALGDLAQASTAADAAVSLEARPSTFLTRALVRQAQGRDAEAALDFASAVKVEEFGDPEEAARTRALWGRFLLRRGDLASAEVVITEALRIIPGEPLALAQAAELALHRGKVADARELFQRAFASSRQVRYLIDLARAQELAKDLAGATSSRTLVEQLVRRDLAEHGVGHRLELVEVLIDRGAPADLAEAVTLAQQELEQRPSAETRFQLARALWRSGARADAAFQIRVVLASGVHDARVYELAARIEGGAQGALYQREAAKLDPINAGWRRLGLGT
jgi:tetratricopeptide (TPR) repeat protein